VTLEPFPGPVVANCGGPDGETGGSSALSNVLRDHMPRTDECETCVRSPAANTNTSPAHHSCDQPALPNGNTLSLARNAARAQLPGANAGRVTDHDIKSSPSATQGGQNIKPSLFVGRVATVDTPMASATLAGTFPAPHRPYRPHRRGCAFASAAERTRRHGAKHYSSTRFALGQVGPQRPWLGLDRKQSGFLAACKVCHIGRAVHRQRALPRGAVAVQHTANASQPFKAARPARCVFPTRGARGFPDQLPAVSASIMDVAPSGIRLNNSRIRKRSSHDTGEPVGFGVDQTVNNGASYIWSRNCTAR